jgi:crotonobetainyl-CoA:carnitine CoA-transferase CaiB-like acyl-CoA transferase
VTYPLNGLVVVDATTGIAGQWAGRLLADWGADVTLVEPPGGTPTRRMPPLAAHPEQGDPEQRDPEQCDPEQGNPATGAFSFLFWNLNAGKHAVTADPATPGGRSALAALAADADVVLHDRVLPDRPSPLPASLPPSVVTCEIADFPADGPYAAWHGTEMIHQALAGVMFITGAPGREPLYGVGHRAYYATGVTAFVTVLAALLERQRSGAGQRTAATVLESAAAMGQNLVTQYSYNATWPRRVAQPGFLAMLRCADGWVVLYGLRSWPGACQAFGVPELAADARFASQAARRANWPAAVDLLRQRAAGLSAAPLVERAQRLKVNIEEVATLGGLAASAQWQARGMTVPAVAPDAAPARALGPVFRLQGGECRLGAPAPPPGPALPVPAALPAEAGAPAEPGASAEPGPPPEPGLPAAAGAPLAGIRVLDFTTAWAGPMATRSLAFLGAHVIKVEPPTRLDSWRGSPRGGVPERFPGREPGARPYNRSGLFNTQGHDKWSLALDLKKPGAREVILALAADTDLVVANFSPGVLDRLGVGYAALSAINPRISVIEMPAFGPGGPAAQHVGMGFTMEAATGMTGLMGYGDGPPVVTGGTYLDPIGGLHGAAAALLALYQRGATGRGSRAEVAQTEAAAHWIGEFFLQQLRTGQEPAPRGNQVAYAAPHDAYACAGEDEWVAVAVRDDGEWQRLCAVIGRADLAAVSRHDPGGHRPAITAWTSRRAKAQAAAALQAAGIPAAPVGTGQDIAGDPALAAAGFLVSLDHPEAGRHTYPGLAFRLARTPGAVRRPAPCFGQHNRAILGGLLGLDDAAIAALYAAGAVADQPAESSEVS